MNIFLFYYMASSHLPGAPCFLQIEETNKLNYLTDLTRNNYTIWVTFKKRTKNKSIAGTK